MRYLSSVFFLFLAALVFSSCAGYKQNIMFQVPENTVKGKTGDIWQKDSSFYLKPFDLVEVRIYNKAGELLVDPEFLLRDKQGNQQNQRENLIYRVDELGMLNLPMIGEVKVSGLKLREAENLIAEKFTKFYDSLFVQMKYHNKRVYVLGANGGNVVPLNNENTTLIEVLALSGGINNDGKAHNIRVIRGDKVMVADLSTIEGYREAELLLQSGDIVYIEPVRRPFTESLRENSPIIGIFTGIVSLTALIVSITSN